MRNHLCLGAFVHALALTVALVAMGCGPTSGGTPTGDGNPGDGCAAGLADCDGDSSNGCEADLGSINSCGVCGTVCGTSNAPGASCSAGACSLPCNTGFADCNGMPADGCETSTTTDDNCGICGMRCSAPNGVGTCVNGACQIDCASGFGDCNSDLLDGCESPLDSQIHCGSCTMSCTGACVGGACETCDSGLALASNDPLDAARAMGMCAGVVQARWILPDGSPAPVSPNYDLGHGIMGAFGSNISPREGAKLLGISSGTARQPSDPGYQDVGGFDKMYTANHPAGFPKESPACPGVTTGQPHDAIALEVTLDVPMWAEGISFDFDFYTYEWPGYVCSTYNDFFVALLNPIPAGQLDGNISFDSMGNPISVNAAFVSVCGCAFMGGPPCMAGGKLFDCANGNAELMGTGFQDIFQDHAATSWLTTTAPVTPGTQITLTFGIYDSGDGVLDSTTLIDNFHWLATPPDVGTEPIP